jgi:preflagellin peptidase FlaK
LIYASWSDWKKREVSNKVWILFAPLAFVLTIVEFTLYSPELFVIFGVSFAITSVMSIALFYLGGFGGADAKALMCLALALPYPVHLVPNVRLYLPVFPFTVFSNSVLLAAFSAVYALFRNSLWNLRNKGKLFAGFEKESAWRKIIVLMTGYKIHPTDLERNPHVYPLEDLTSADSDENKRVLLSYPKDEDRDQIVARISSAARNGKIQNDVWVTPGLPLLIFITAGLVIALFVGDLIWILLGFVMVAG